MKLSIIIPCYNEPGTIGPVVDRVLAVPFPAGWEREVVVVDDGSGAETKSALAQAQAKHSEIKVITRARNGGKGAALKDGFAAASGDYLMIQDADLEYDPADIPLLINALTPEHQVIWGSRQIAHNNVPGRFYYYWGGRLVNIFFNICYGTRLSDLTTCYKLFPRRLVPELVQQPSNDFVYDAVELSRVLVHPESGRGAREQVTEVSIRYHARSAHEGKKLRAKDGIRCLLRIIMLRFAPHARVIKFIIVGGTAALVNVLALYILTDWFGVWYIASEVAAFIIALCYNFALQKLWTFASASSTGSGQASSARASAGRQFPLFIFVNVCNLVLNAGILYGLVELGGLYYLAAQLLASLIIAFESYFLYRLIFR
jgi:dolichol-phosphate mannosyltransferase